MYHSMSINLIIKACAESKVATLSGSNIISVKWNRSIFLLPYLQQVVSSQCDHY